MDLVDLFDGIPRPLGLDSGAAVYSATAVPDQSNYYVARDCDSLACFLISTYVDSQETYSPVRLEGLEVQFELRCYLSDYKGRAEERTLTVLRCRDKAYESIRVFFLVCEAALRRLGDRPILSEIAVVVDHLSAMFEKARRARARTVAGLFGELYVLSNGADTVATVSAWRADVGDRFDFAVGDFRLDVKVTTGRQRIHSFSFDQCNPARGLVAVVASLFAQEVGAGVSMRSLIRQVEDRISGYPDLVFKLHTTVASTLGSGLDDALSRQFDIELARSSLRFFRVGCIPAIRGELPTGVSDVHFRSDLATAEVSSTEDLISLAPAASGLLPKPAPTFAVE